MLRIVRQYESRPKYGAVNNQNRKLTECETSKQMHLATSMTADWYTQSIQSANLISVGPNGVNLTQQTQPSPNPTPRHQLINTCDILVSAHWHRHTSCGGLVGHWDLAFHWFIYLFFDWMTDWFIYLFIVLFIYLFIYLFIAWMTDWLIDWFIDWLIDWLIDNAT